MVELQINIFCQFIDWQNECNSGFFDKVSLTTFGIVWTMLIAEILPFVGFFDKVSLTTFGIVWTMLIAEILPFVSHE